MTYQDLLTEFAACYSDPVWGLPRNIELYIGWTVSIEVLRVCWRVYFAELYS